MGVYFELIKTIFEPVDHAGKLRNRVVVFTSAAPEEGVSYVVNTFAEELATQTHKRVVVVDLLALQSIHLGDANQIYRHCSETQIDNLLVLSTQDSASAVSARSGPTRVNAWRNDHEYRKGCLKALRWNFDYVVIDAPSLASSAEVTSIAPFVDGVAVVVAANRTRSRQIQRAQQIVEGAGGKFLGFILNKRRYPIPSWLYRRL